MTTPTELDGLTRELALARATDLARAGRYDDAGTLLADDPSPAALDLLARMHAQRGRLAEADECWARAGAAGGSGYERERQRVAALQQRRMGTSRLLRRIGLALLALAVLAAALLLWFRPAGGGTGELADLRAQQDGISRQLETLESRLAAPPAAPSEEPDLGGLAAELPPSLQVREAGAELLITLPVAPFDSGIGLTPEGEATLGELGGRLAGRAEEVSVRVVGHTDDIPPRLGGPFADNAELGLARALAAARQLSVTSGIPLDGFAVASAGDAAAPFPNTDDASRARNRTVTIEVGPAG